MQSNIDEHYFSAWFLLAINSDLVLRLNISELSADD
ncbi:hypothetical protein EM595_p0542 (plasmid) [Duffyella gerundensis]|uniref:Uncharacterized protein n=1 Tax=Duffyella gerundensis TaxID=1619313 RepID=A0A0U5L736_9GAMM|nr:hypothetical protein EM595_p0542 [Duffyella gerundensis]